MKRWIVNAAERSVREPRNAHDIELQPGEFFWDGSYADAMAAGARRRLAEEALSVRGRDTLTVVVKDRIESQLSNTRLAAEQLHALADVLRADGYDVWREGSGLLVLGRLP